MSKLWAAEASGRHTSVLMSALFYLGNTTSLKKLPLQFEEETDFW